ncbi:hypothetical protein RAC90_07185, partial [Pantoea sp. CS_6]|uniref:hypothetical protein n=1 Tax=Pantoea sp. CS_6 TaxID=3055795 RepID=UPI0035BF2CD3
MSKTTSLRHISKAVSVKNGRNARFLFLKRAGLAVSATVCLESERLRGFFELPPCQPKIFAYNAPPLTRHNGLRNAVFSRELPGVFAGEKLLKKRLTLKEESVIYATSQQTVNPLIALLFNN